MKIKNRHKEYFKANEINSLSDLAVRVIELKKLDRRFASKEEVDMMFELIHLMINNKEDLETFFSPAASKLATRTQELLKEAEEYQKIQGRVESESETDIPYKRVCDNLNFTEADFLKLNEEDEEWISADLTSEILQPFFLYNSEDYKPLQNLMDSLAEESQKNLKRLDSAIEKMSKKDNLHKVFMQPTPKRLFCSPITCKPDDCCQGEPFHNTTIGKKEKDGKLDYSEINFKLLDLMAERFNSNKDKYPKGNTLKKINKDDILWAAFRHIRKMIQPIKGDPETYEQHLAAVATNMSIIVDQIYGNDSLPSKS